MLPQKILSLPLLSTVHNYTIPNYTTSPSGNPFLSGWYADPDAKFFPSTGLYWVYPTSSRPYAEQTYLDAFSSPDLVHWTKHPSVLTTASVPWAVRALWAPCVVARHGRYYLYFSANDIQPGEDVTGGIGVAVSDSPAGPFEDALGRPLIGAYHHGAQPIDQDVFVDDDGQAYIYYGGHGRAVVAKLDAGMTSLVPLLLPSHHRPDEVFREITPAGYTEGPVVFKRKGVYHLMWSEGGWGGPNYAVAYGTSDSPLGPFERRPGRVLEQDAAVARGSGHNGVVAVPGTGEGGGGGGDDDVWYIVYHRRPLRETDENHRVVCYDRMEFDEETGEIRPVRMLVRDDFADGAMIAWRTYGDGFEVVDEEMRNAVPEGGLGRVAGLALLDTNFTDLVYEADVRVLVDGEEEEEEDGEAGLVFRATKTGPEDGHHYDGYYVSISTRRKTVAVGKVTYGSVATFRSEAEMHVRVGKTYRLRVTAVGNEFKVFVDDMTAPVLASVDDSGPAYVGGQNGVFVTSVQAAFDNVAIDKA